MHGKSSISISTEEYLEQIYRLGRREDEVTTTDLARRLNVSPPSVTGMLKRLGERGLIQHRPYQGVTLTEEGRAIAVQTIRRHELVERLLTDVLGLPWHLADTEACRLEHHITPPVEERLAIFLKHPLTCPHGQPLDPEQPDDAVRLSTLEPGDRARVARMGDEEPQFLHTVDQLGLRPNARLTVRERASLNGPLMVAVGEQLHALVDDVAREIWVEKLE
jgi:DtxR family Mn-dependent transcriptional regulator